ncbi:TPA: acetyl-CoA carboxylase biotin carboxylase subunit [Clostridioides difficile]|uniref:acetyl-CoA carboxylase biotin carboxylase subunit n=1 Tax=Clostridioides difficile TaxID=1496 RepID=UPI00093C8A86|nr:acetyl-CoA carboxylase biotin carboxylase subunit [Clostridioides difficile]MCV2287399.1 acetyl-CoA carboxylase biotin carboxylase subunit [Clostridioides difficile]HBG2785709.1 acetyl-CoA carboxylase biotin carboxylase subunit [Clostridioides difficile]HEL5707048.1 acetyl-CoA carboxylase biotin carboxylase subunit [Clostridioides difficile]
MIKKILVANRGDIAVRIIRTCKELGIKTVAIYSEIDKDCFHRYIADESICIGPNNISKSYNNIENIIYLALKLKCDAIHPGFGFLSENPEFAKQCEDNNITFIGPTREQMILMGDKSRARETMMELNIPVVPGSESVLKTKEEALEVAREIGYPVMIKASSGGGGKGMRIVRKEEELFSNFDMASSEALAAFSNSDLYMEKFIENPRHIEVQVFGDKHSNAIHLGDRDCSMQRRNQKVIEESLSPYLSDEERQKLHKIAVDIVKGVGYIGAGTIEFIVDKDKNFYFIEMNTRIQVEHPVTEMVTNLDLIKLQISIANGDKIPFKQEDITFRGHAIECRINAEDSSKNFAPSPGKIESLNLPGGFGVRFDTFVYAGYTIPPLYDSMIGKLICWAETREECISRIYRALDEIIVEGINTNVEFQKALVTSEEFREDTHHTKFIEDVFMKKEFATL